MVRPSQIEQPTSAGAHSNTCHPTSVPDGHLLRIREGQITPDEVLTAADTGDVNIATLSYGVGNWFLLRGDTARARSWFERSVRSGGWPAFGFIVSEAELRRLR